MILTKNYLKYFQAALKMPGRSMDLRIQEEILKKHQENDIHSLRKSSGNCFSYFVPNFDIVHAFNWLELDTNKLRYLPNFESCVQTSYEIDFGTQMEKNYANSPRLDEENGIVYFKPKKGELLKLTLSPIPDLFYLRNLANENGSLFDFIVKEKENMPLGEDADEFRMSYLLEWILEYGMLIEHENFQKLIADGADGRPLFKRGQKLQGKKSKYGIDWAKTNDLTWCFHGYEMGDHLQITDWIKFYGTNYPDQIDGITRFGKDHGEGYLVNDSTGVGDAPNDFLKREFGPAKVKGLKYTAPSKDALIKDWRTLLPSKKSGTGIFFPK